MNKILIVLLIVLGNIGIVQGQNTNIQVQVQNNGSNIGSQDYTINGISKSKDIGGVDITAKQTSIEFGFLSSRGFAYNGTLPIVSGITLTNYNSSPVTVILQLNYKTNVGLKPYPRFYDEEEKTMTIVLPSYRESGNSKFIELPPAGSKYVTEIISADMIVRPLH